MEDNKIKYLLDLVIENYINKWEPIWSKFLFSLEETAYAPSTLRKYLNHLEKEWLLFQPYHSAWRIPTLKAFSRYVWDIMHETTNVEDYNLDIDYARNWLRNITEILWTVVDWTVVWFLKNDEYFYLWINNLLKDSISNEMDFETTKYIIKFVEEKRLISYLENRMLKTGVIYYDFLEDWDKILSTIFAKIEVNWFDWIISIIWPIRVDYKKNITILKKFFQLYNKI